MRKNLRFDDGTRRLIPTLFVRIFLVIVGALLIAQALNFASVFFVRFSGPAVYPMGDVAQALRTGRDSASLKVDVGDPPAESSQDRRDLRLRAHLADRLGIDASGVRVRVSRPPSIADRKGLEDDGVFGKTVPPAARTEAEEGRDRQLVGRFSAAMRLDEGRWRRVQPRQAGIEPWQWELLSWLAGTFLIAVPLAWLLARRVAAPVDVFSAAADRLGRDLNAPPLDQDVPAELRPAVLALNDMQGRLKRYVDDRVTMIAAIAHDLRTPLMRLSLMVEDAPPAIKAPAQAQIKEMSERIGSALAFVRGVGEPVRRRRVNLRTLVESVADEMADRGADVAVESGPDLIVDADVAGLRALFVNLIGNAVQYAAHARIGLRCQDRHALVEIVDTGCGIPEAELERVFEPFYRVESSRNPATGGTGLGLASARSVARAHGGDVTLANRSEGGLAARVWLPLAGPPAS